MLPQVVGLVGPIRAGKSSVSEILREEFHYRQASNSELLRQILDRLELQGLRTNLGALGNAIFEVLGNDTLAHFRIRNLGTERIVIDGIRYQEEIIAYSTVPGFLLVAVNCSDSERLRRLQTADDRHRETISSEQSFRALASARSELFVPDLMKRAHHTIKNDGDLTDLRDRVRELFLPR